MTQVVLINTVSGYDNFPQMDRGRHSLSLATIKASLMARGFTPDRIHLLPGEEGYACEKGAVAALSAASQALLLRELGEIIDDREPVVLGVSAICETIPRLVAISAVIRRNYPGLPIIGGGPAFTGEGEPQSLLAMLLRNGDIDGAVSGHASSFFPVCEQAGQIARVNVPGFYQRDAQGKIVGTSRGSYPLVDRVPFVTEQKAAGDRAISIARMITSTLCTNSCGFCCESQGRPVAFAPEIIKKTLRELLPRMGIGQMEFYDANPFERRPHGLLSLLSEIENSWPMVFKGGDFDPSLLLDVEYRKEWMPVAIEHGFFSFHIGRQVVTAENARAIGVCYRKEVKSQARLDAEKQAMLRLIYALKKVKDRFKYCVPFHLYIMYIVTPDETRDSILKMVEEMEEFSGKTEEGKMTVTTFFQPLMLFPGSRIRRQYIDRLRDPGDFLHPERSLMVSTPLIEALLEIDQGATPPDYFARFRQAIDNIFPAGSS